MLKKCFILTQFGSPHSWTQEYFDHLGRLEKDGWYWKIFTPNKYQNVPPNVEIVKMTIEDFNVLIEKKLNISVGNYLIDGRPVKAVSDFYIASGKIFEDYLKGFDYWGITNWDIVYGNLSKFLPDSELEKYHIWTDDVNTINGIFCLFQNSDGINHLFEYVKDWQIKFKNHQLYGTDEIDMTEVIRNVQGIKIGYPPHYALHSHDRLEQHISGVKLEMKDGTLYELFKDIAPPNWIHKRPFIGKEIMYFHFLKTKQWPTLQ